MVTYCLGLTPDQIESSLINKKSQERRGNGRDDVDETVQDVGLTIVDKIFVHQENTARIKVWCSEATTPHIRPTSATTMASVVLYC